MLFFISISIISFVFVSYLISLVSYSVLHLCEQGTTSFTYAWRRRKSEHVFEWKACLHSLMDLNSKHKKKIKLPSLFNIVNWRLLRTTNFHSPFYLYLHSYDCISSETACSTLLPSSKQADKAGCTEREREQSSEREREILQNCIYILLIKCPQFRSGFMRYGSPLTLPSSPFSTPQ